MFLFNYMINIKFPNSYMHHIENFIFMFMDISVISILMESLKKNWFYFLLSALHSKYIQIFT